MKFITYNNKWVYYILVQCFLWSICNGQDTTIYANKFFAPATQPNKARIIGVNASMAATYTGMMLTLNQAWYSQYPRSKFHFYNDNSEWLQIDKLGHTWTAYVESRYGWSLYNWSGIDDKKAIWLGGMTGFVGQTTIEILDGFSKKWGASPGDLAANTLGSGLFIAQQLLWNEQRIKMKFSSHPTRHTDQDINIQNRAKDLFGNNILERILKDYNGQSYWFSFCPWSFSNNSNRRLQWLNVSIGYSVENIYGGYRNTWLYNNQAYDYSSLPRNREYFLSFDVDLERIKTKKKWAKTILYLLNIIKIPAPALSINNEGVIKLYPFIYY